MRTWSRGPSKISPSLATWVTWTGSGNSCPITSFKVIPSVPLNYEGKPPILNVYIATLQNGWPTIELSCHDEGWEGFPLDVDGRIARMTNTASPFGRELDSLADVVTFGVAPAVLAYVWGMRAIVELAGTHQLTQNIPWLVTFAYVICGAARLARFNIDTVKPTSDRRFFVGMPIPAAAGFIAAVVHYYKQPVATWTFSLAWLVVVGVLGFLMVSRMRYYSFKALDLRKRRTYLAIIAIGLVIGGMWFYSEPVLLTVAITYAVSGIVLRITSKIRPHPPAPEEVHAA